MASITLRGSGQVDEIARKISDALQSGSFSCTLVDAISRQMGEHRMQLMVFEKYYMRASNRASLTVSVLGNGQSVTVDAIGSGGGQGPIFKLSWGAEEDFVTEVYNCLEPYGFTVIREN